MRHSFVLSAILFVLFSLFESCNKCREGCENGICIKRVCECDIWWRGNACDKSVLTEFEGFYSGKRDCEGKIQNVDFDLNVNPKDPSQLLLESQYILQFTTQTRFSVLDLAGDSLGEGEMLLDKISFNTLIIDSVQSTFCLTSAALK